MAKALKVFAAQIGFYDTVVAAPSKAAALRAWGTRQDLFAEGLAHPVDDDHAVAAAREHPGVVLRRPAGSKARFALEPEAFEAPKPTARPPKPKPDRKALEAAETAVARLEVERSAQQREIETEQAALDERRRALDKTYGDKLAAARGAVEREREAYQRSA